MQKSLTFVFFFQPIKLPELKFNHCNGSDSSKRGYPCTLWVLFHSLTVKQAILNEQNKCKLFLNQNYFFMTLV